MQQPTTKPAAAERSGSRARRTARTTAASHTNPFFDGLVFFLLAALLALGPVVRGGNRQVALVALLALGLLLLACLGAATTWGRLPGARAPQSWASGNSADLGEIAGTGTKSALRLVLLGLVGTCPLWLGLLQLTPLPAALWTSLAGRGVYGDALASAGAALPGALPLSLHPTATWTALLSGIPTAAAFFAALYLPARWLDKALGVLLLVGACEILLALLQFSQGRTSFFYFSMPGAGGFVGSFANRNHLADFLAMLVPLWFYRVAQSRSPAPAHINAAAHRSSATRSGNRSGRLASMQLPLWMFFGFALLVVVLSTLSRGGLLATTLVLLASSLLWMATVRHRLGRRQRVGLWAVVLVFAGLALGTAGLEGLGKRMDNQTLSLDAQTRSTYTQATLEAARTFWPWGSGVGTFESVFPRFQAVQSPGYVEYAHNDYAQLAMELGLAGVLLALALAWLVLAQLRALWRARGRGGRLSQALVQQAYCGLGASALLVHSVVEFNMHIPALATTAAFLLGVYLRPLPLLSSLPPSPSTPAPLPQ